MPDTLIRNTRCLCEECSELAAKDAEQGSPILSRPVASLECFLSRFVLPVERVNVEAAVGLYVNATNVGEEDGGVDIDDEDNDGEAASVL